MSCSAWYSAAQRCIGLRSLLESRVSKGCVTPLRLRWPGYKGSRNNILEMLVHGGVLNGNRACRAELSVLKGRLRRREISFAAIFFSLTMMTDPDWPV